MTALLRAAADGNLSALLTALNPDVVLTSDGGGQVPAARRPVHGGDRVARFVPGITVKIRPGEQVQVINVNGAPGLGLFDSDGLTAVVSLTVSSDRITRVDLIRGPGSYLAWARPPAAWLCAPAMMSSAGCTTGWRRIHTPPYGGSG